MSIPENYEKISLAQAISNRYKIYEKFINSIGDWSQTDPELIQTLMKYNFNLRDGGESKGQIDEIENMSEKEILILANFLANIHIQACDGDSELALEYSKEKSDFMGYFSHKLNLIITAILSAKSNGKIK